MTTLKYHTSLNGGAAFPFEYRITQGGKEEIFIECGMTLRDYFAAAALPAVMRDHTEWAAMAYKMADAMLAERAKPIAEGEEKP